ncbi:transposase [Streptomyces sp. NPDC001165]|uniref:transposase n=1 Tax=Streptomyces sp. NPDC001165 TaxID=3364546 RepID=UPI003673ECF5
MGRSRGGFATTVHLSADGRSRLLSVVVTPGQRADSTQFTPVVEKIRAPRHGRRRPRKKPQSVVADKAYSNGLCCQYLRERGIRHAVPEKTDSQGARLRKGSGGERPPASTKSGTRSATPSSERSTHSSTHEQSPPATTGAASSFSALSPSQPSSSGSARDRPVRSWQDTGVSPPPSATTRATPPAT